jgi:hypothetical protein
MRIDIVLSQGPRRTQNSYRFRDASNHNGRNYVDPRSAAIGLTRAARAAGISVAMAAMPSSPNGRGWQCTVSIDDDFLVARLAADRAAATRVDLSWCDGEGVEFLRMPDTPVRGGRRGRFGVFAFHHTRTIPDR